MAFKKYAYYNKGNKFALVESEMSSGGGNLAVAHCTLGGYTTKATCEAAGGQWIPSSTGSSTGVWEKYISPKEAVTDGIELEYAYVPTYRIESVEAADKETVTSWETAGGYLRFNGTGFSTESSVDYIVVSGSSKWDGLHKVTGLNTAHYTTDTKYSGANVTETPTIYTNVSALTDESFELDLPEYQAQAIVYYLKAKLSEDMRDADAREYFMRLFKKQMEKAASSRKRGPYMVQGFSVMRNR